MGKRQRGVPEIEPPTPEEAKDIPGLAEYLMTRGAKGQARKTIERDFVPWEICGPFLWRWFQEEEQRRSGRREAGADSA